MKDVYTTLSGFFGEQVTPLGEVSVLIMIGEAPHHRSEQITFLIVRSNSPNNMLLRRTAIAGLGMVPSTMHSAIRRNMEAYVDDMVIKSMDETYTMADIRETFEWLRKINMKLNPKKCSFGMEEGQFLGQTREADKAFEEMKRYIEKLPTLVAPKAGENLIVYLAASKECINAVLMAERGKDQRPIYFVSRVLHGAELNYPIMEKLVLALIYATRGLKRYFQAHNITVLTNKPIRLLLSKPKKSGRVARWAIELGEHKIEFKPRNAVKAQILTDFLAETKEEDEEMDLQEKQQPEQTTRWKLYTDGASSGDGSRAGLMVVSPEGT
ncbi:reverse transcriptase domain-containing protein [Tanacetum coccineum]